MEKILQVDVTIMTRCRLQMVRDVYEKLNTNYKNKLSESCFGSLLRLKNIKLASQVIHQLLLRKIMTNKKEVWFKIGEKNAKFGLEEFILVTGLNVGDDNDVDKTLGEECRIVKEYFKNSGGKITKGDAYNAFIWAFEAIPTLGMKFGMKYLDVIPRMVAWEMPKRLTSAVIENVLNSKELEVNSTLIPIEAELEEAYWKELKPIMEEDESVSHHSEGDEAEQDVEPQYAYHEKSPRAAQPSQHGFEINVEDLLRTKIENFEGRLQAIISTRLDWVEKKVDRLVELAVVGRFHPATSAFDGATSSTSYVPENEPKDRLENEVGFDDVTDVHDAERKVDLPEEDSKLEEEEDVRGKNVGGKELETEPGFDDVRDMPAAETNVEAREEDPKSEKEEEHPDVEKGIADFVTPEKHDVKTNESTQGDDVEIDEARSDPSKGRGYHRKRKARLLCSSYTDLTKRRKLSDINVYDAY
ncbi:Hypothetical predicted protein [Olea europaea subsp. europaea]|uniref:DUF1985 domain-containing protein n=1 Tax=Olea europaea subsp. europaea TaxID=158383 RepID=A0A8S0URR6_OLEEU|nr:Hypothetical predicted protein [Olea europaea subsp. europaea]